MEPHEDGITVPDMTAPGGDTHTQHDVGVGEQLDPRVQRIQADDALHGPQWPRSTIRTTQSRMEWHNIKPTNHFHSAFIPTWLDVQPKDPHVVRSPITATDADEVTIDVAVEAAAGEDKDSQRIEQTNPQEQLEREQDQVRYRILLDAIRGQFQDTGTVEELTASQFRTVYDYVVSNNILRDLVKYLKVPHRETTLVRTEDHEAAAQIIHSLRLTLNAATEATHSFHNLAVLLGRGSPLRYSYTVLMGWIHELTYQITSINVQRDQLTELVLPRLLTPSSQQDYFRNTFQLFNITEDLFGESLQYASAVTAHATRMIRVLEAYQMLQVLHHRVTPHDEEDAEYTHLMQANMPETLDPSSYIETLRWWRENYSGALMIHNTRGYLRRHEVDRMLHEQQGQQSTMTAHTTQPPQPIRPHASGATGPAVYHDRTHYATPTANTSDYDPGPSSYGASNIRFRVPYSIRLGRIGNVCSAASSHPAVRTTPADAHDSDRWTLGSTTRTSRTATCKAHVAGSAESRSLPCKEIP
ncbi:unnamed protein product [Heligmosomoides polygyrus]|uniref:Ubiquitinyl hydrolase 1 n=1 Tax=Heligmosomoides polygyrus TaxID=6339 RepID=A0A183GJW9_HELPZ|nr:unnamed protein product [Heligmosomoides polygyrus]